MTETKTSYLTGLSLANQYAKVGAFKGNWAADFGAILLFRDATPLDGFSTEQKFLCGNLQGLDPVTNTKGWGIRWTAGPQPSAELELLYGDGSLAEQSVAIELASPAPMTLRTLLVHVFFLADPNVSAPNNVTALIYVNGALAARSDGLSFTPADNTGTFRIGGMNINGTIFNAHGVGVSGFGYCNSIPGASLAAKLAAAQAVVDVTTNQTLGSGDVSDNVLVTHLFSVRRALSSPAPVWVASKGSTNLTRVGSTSLAVESGSPLFSDAPWASGDIGPTGAFDLYVSQAGSDANPGTQSQPLATLFRAESLIPSILNGSQYKIHLNSGSHLLPERGSFLRSRLLQNGARIEVFADDAWDPAVVTEIATGAALAGSGAAVVKALGLTDDQYQDYTIEIMTVGGVPVPLAERERRHIRNNSATDIVPVGGFFNAPTTGDTYRILQLNCDLQAPTLPGPGVQDYAVVEDCPCALLSEFSSISYIFGSELPAVSPSGIVLRGFNLRGSSTFAKNFTFGRTQLFAFGLERPIDDPPFTNFFVINGTNTFAGVGLPEYRHLTGWGMKLAQKDGSDTARTSLNIALAASFFGFLHEALADSTLDGDESPPAHTVTVMGGVARRFFDSAHMIIFGDFVAGIPYLVQVPTSNRMATLDGFLELLVSLSNVEVVNALGSLGGCCLVRGNSTLVLSSQTVGQPAAGAFVEAASGGRILIFLFGSPLQFGDAVATDYKVAGVAPVNKSFFNAPGATLLGTDGSMITVVE